VRIEIGDREIAMYKNKTIAVVIPAYNEEGFVGEVMETVPSFVDRLYVIDDTSTDGTWEEIQTTAKLMNDEPMETPFENRVVAIQHSENRGVGGAIKTGYQHARADEIDVTAVMGGDGQMDPTLLDRIIEPVVNGDAAYAKGNRLTEPENHAQMPRHRQVGNGILSYLTKIATGYWDIGDPQMGYTAISLEALETAEIDEMFEFYGYCNDLLVRLSIAELPIADVPSPLKYGDETSHIKYHTYIPRVSLMLLRVFLWRLYRTRTSAIGTIVALLFISGAVGVLAGAVSLVRTVTGSEHGAITSVREATGGVALLGAAMALDAGRNRKRNWREPIEAAKKPAESLQDTTKTPVQGEEQSADTDIEQVNVRTNGKPKPAE